MTNARWMGLIAGWVAAIGSSWATGPGLAATPDDLGWLRWQGRLLLTTEASAQASLVDASSAPGLSRTRSAALFGDVFLSRPWFGDSGGARVTSGLLVGQRGSVLGPGATSAVSFSGVSSHWGRVSGAALGQGDGSAEGTATWPYLGVGYSGASARYGLNFSADLGLAAQNPAGIRFGRVGAVGFDDWARDLRLTPVLQLGVSYTF